MQSSGFDGIVLTDLETGVRDFHDRLRRLMPVMALPEPPPPDELKACNATIKPLHTTCNAGRDYGATGTTHDALGRTVIVTLAG